MGPLRCRAAAAVAVAAVCLAAQRAGAAVAALPPPRGVAAAAAAAAAVGGAATLPASPTDRGLLVDLAGLWGNLVTATVGGRDGAGDGAGGAGTVLPRTRRDSPTPAVLILLHGYASSSAARLDDVAQSLTPALREHLSIVAPSTRRRDAAGNGRSWFAFTRAAGARGGVYVADPAVDAGADLAAARARVDGLVAAAVAAGVERSRVVVAGYSQGGGVAMDYGLRSPPGLGGVLSYAGFLPAPGGYGGGDGGAAATRGGRVLLAHAADDGVTPAAAADVAAAAFRAAGWAVDRPPLTGGHAVFAAAGGVVSAWLTNVLRLGAGGGGAPRRRCRRRRGRRRRRRRGRGRGRRRR
ncbi:hypothetical protein I4F81_011259 [Pyropia yezoensis]|uniref:Uncharacterized protein n=1 Tax=Pyropia yezoensis TaxID=2788 RepID=A0ACC3CG73_PYRYE|nr:hypothetical protein I4F81_011259 [Neopyropia yezoensis]